MQSLDKSCVVFLATYGDAHVLFAVKSLLVAAVAHEDVVFLEHGEYEPVRRERREDFAEEVVRLRWHDPQELYLAEFLFEFVSRGDEFVAGAQVILLVLVVNLHEEFGEAVDVPDAHAFLDIAYEFFVGTA